MLFRKRLKGLHVAVLATEGFEQVELTIPTKALRAEGAHVEVLSLRRGKIRGLNLYWPGRTVRVDRTVEQAAPADYDALLLPGGFINPDLLRQSRAAREFVRAIDEAGKPIATLCHGPWVLASAGRLNGRQLTSWPGIRDDLVHAGAVWRDEAVVRDGNWVSSRGPHDLASFTRAMIELFAERDSAAPKGAASHAISAPQQSAPPPWAVAGMVALSRAYTARRLLGAAAVLGAGILALRRLARQA
ncbi:type 1 glutamine amidotransferase domain-containing protein [Sorangium sp. So ce381]|uniref:type 1 glutamine amidotransferase domain-containing protein n=1 Tax=Sorangium sp. So ce381 TaxID=3133307 RepID=UPI003F5B00AB